MELANEFQMLRLRPILSYRVTPSGRARVRLVIAAPYAYKIYLDIYLNERDKVPGLVYGILGLIGSRLIALGVLLFSMSFSQTPF